MEAIELVCTYEQAKELKRLGAPQDSYFSWADAKKFDGEGNEEDETFPILFQPCSGEMDLEAVSEFPDSCYTSNEDTGDEDLDTGAEYAAFTSDEIQALLPENIPLVADLAHGKAALLIKLIEEGHVKFEDVVH